MKLKNSMSKEEWKALLEFVKEIPGARITSFAKTDKNGYFGLYEYFTFEYDGEFYYIQRDEFDALRVCKFLKLSPYEKRQNAYPISVHSTEELLEYMANSKHEEPLEVAHKQRIYLTELYGIRDSKTNLQYLKHTLASFREKAILSSLNHITMEMNNDDYCTLRFHSNDGEWFEYETKSRRITG